MGPGKAAEGGQALEPLHPWGRPRWSPGSWLCPGCSGHLGSKPVVRISEVLIGLSSPPGYAVCGQGCGILLQGSGLLEAWGSLDRCAQLLLSLLPARWLLKCWAGYWPCGAEHSLSGLKTSPEPVILTLGHFALGWASTGQGMPGTRTHVTIWSVSDCRWRKEIPEGSPTPVSGPGSLGCWPPAVLSSWPAPLLLKAGQELKSLKKAAQPTAAVVARSQ